MQLKPANQLEAVTAPLDSVPSALLGCGEVRNTVAPWVIWKTQFPLVRHVCKNFPW